MSGHSDPLPQAARPLVTFAGALRRHGFAVAPDQTIGFVEAVGALGPRHMEDIRRAGLAMLAPPAERRAEFNAIFRRHFHGQIIAAAASSTDEDDVQIQDERDGFEEVPEPGEVNVVGGEATAAEALSLRVFDALGEEDALRRFAREAPRDWRDACPDDGRRESPAGPGTSGAASGKPFAMTVMWSASRAFGVKPNCGASSSLIDVSGSMKMQTQSALRFSHVLAHAAPETEIFAFGTRLTRITRALRLRNLGRALDSASILVADWDGGTRIGDALEAFLAMPRFAGFARGAAVVIVSDGLERGEPDAMVRAITRLSRLAWRLDWLTPLAADPEFAPRTRALQEVLPMLSALGDGSRTQSLCAHLLTIADAA